MRLTSPSYSFFFVSDTYEPTGDGSADNVFITKSFDASTHFQSDTIEVQKLYENITGTKLNLDISAEPSDLQEM